MFGEDETTIATLRDAAQALRSVTTPDTETAKALKAAIDVLTTELSVVLAEIDETKAHEDDGASSIATWGRRELHQDAGRTRQLVRAARTFRDLPSVGEAARTGELSFEHVNAFTFALKHVGHDETRQLEGPLLDLAKTVAPGELFEKVRNIRDVLHGDDLDKAWLDGMEKHDIRLKRCGEGFVPTGFLDIETGVLFKTIMNSLSIPRDADDDRTLAERRMDAFTDLCRSVLENGLPADNGIRPHLFVTVEADTLKAIADESAQKALDLDLKPAHLEGFGPIGPQLLSHLLCGAEITPILVKTIGRNTEVLDVGRTERLATPKQAKAIRHRQNARCASPGCHHPIAHNHHQVWWTHGGNTDLDDLDGRCRKCHALIHAGKLDVTRGSPQTV